MLSEKPEDKVKRFFEAYKTVTCKKGEILIRAEEEPPGIIYLKEGTVKEYAISKKGEEIVVNIFKPGAFFPISWAVHKTFNGYFFEAAGQCVAVVAPAHEVVKFIRQEPEVLFDLLSRYLRGMDGVLTRMTHLMAGDAYSQLVTELIILTKRFGKKLKTTEKELAGQTGMSRETVSRQMKKLKTRGMVKFGRRGLIVTDVTKLETELG